MNISTPDIQDIIPDNPDDVFRNIEDDNQNPVQEAGQKERLQFIYEAVRDLSEDQQTVIIMKFINDLPNSEIAELLGKKEEAVRQLQSRGIKKLREKFKGIEI